LLIVIVMKETLLKIKVLLLQWVVKLYQYLCSDKREYVLSKQLLRSGTSEGAMIREAEHAQSTADFIHKKAIAQKTLTINN